jgi:hypothetical protein
MTLFGLIWFIAFNAILNNISVILWRSVLLVEETGVPGENHRPAILDYHSIKRCFHYNGSAGVSFLLQQCIALDDFSEGHSDYYTFG